MKKSVVLKNQRAEKVAAQGTMISEKNSRSEGERDFSEQETVAFRKLDNEIKALDAKILDAEMEERAEERAAAAGGQRVDPAGDPALEQPQERYSLHKALRSQLTNGIELDGIELEVSNLIKREAAKQGISITGVAIPVSVLAGEQRAVADGQTVTLDGGAYGGNLVGTDQRGVIDALRPRPVLERLGATYLTGLQGNIEFAVNDGGIAATWETEIAYAGETRNAYGKKTMSPKRLSVTVPISKQNLIQSSIDLEAYTMNEINSVLANKIDETCINGSGVGAIPTGILNTAGINVVAMGTDGAAPTWDSIVDLETGIEVANATGAKQAYLVNPATKGKLKKTKHTAGDATYLMTTGNEINGHAVGVTSLVPSNITKGTGTNLEYPYPEPALVPLGEKPKV